jgi:hypothetical protein
MAVHSSNWFFLALCFVCVIPACALLWNTFFKTSWLQDELYRQAQYETCFFIFFFIAVFIIAIQRTRAAEISVLRTLAVAIIVYITIYGDFINFTNLNNLRIVNQGSKNYYFPVIQQGPLDNTYEQKYLAGLILGYLALFFGLLSTLHEFKLLNIPKLAGALLILAFLVAVPGLVVCWAADAATYSQLAAAGDVNGQIIDSTIQNLLFVITTFTILQWIVLFFGFVSGGYDLICASAFIYGIGGLAFPIYFFQIQYYDPSDKNFTWAGPILCWIATFIMFVSAAVTAPNTRKENTV